MWTPSQWIVAFAIMTAVVLGLEALWLRAAAANETWLVAVAAGVIAGIFAIVAWTLRRLLAGVAVLCAGAALVVIGAAEASADVGILTALVTAAACAAWIVPHQMIYTAAAERPRPREPEHFGEANAPRHALVVYHPSPRGSLAKHLRTFAGALAAHGWQVELTTAHKDNKARASKHDLVVLAAPVFNFRPARALVEHARRLDIKDKPTVVVVSGYGMTEPAERALHKLAAAKGAKIVSSFPVWTMRSNDERHGIADVGEIMRRAAAGIAETVAPASSQDRAVHDRPRAASA